MKSLKDMVRDAIDDILTNGDLEECVRNAISNIDIGAKLIEKLEDCLDDVIDDVLDDVIEDL